MIRYLKARFSERSTLVGIGVAITAASALPWPWSIASFVVGSIAAMIPDGKVGQ
jgi:hypothetical protein